MYENYSTYKHFFQAYTINKKEKWHHGERLIYNKRPPKRKETTDKTATPSEKRRRCRTSDTYSLFTITYSLQNRQWRKICRFWRNTGLPRTHGGLCADAQAPSEPRGENAFLLSLLSSFSLVPAYTPHNAALFTPIIRQQKSARSDAFLLVGNTGFEPVTSTM